MLFVGGVRQAATIKGLRWPSHRTIDAAPDLAERILALHREPAQPPQSALMMMMQQSQLPFGGRDEEEFIAELAAATSPTLANVAAQRAAIALRPLAQEPVWHAEMRSPTTAALLAEFGVRVVIKDEIPQAWHPYYRARLARALGDMRSVLPKLVLEGLTIEIADIDTTATHLAFHDPGARLIRLAPRAVMGSLAHELGHDLDWQIARRSYRRQASYASDYAADVAATMERTTPWARLTMRPTEVLARQFDWVVYMMLAEQGRMNATLTSVQHEWLPGHGGARPPAANVRSATAFAGVIERAVRLDGSMSDAIKRAVLAYDVPTSVHAVRAARSGIGRLPPGVTASGETRSYIEALFVAAGVMKPASPGDYVNRTTESNRNAITGWSNFLDLLESRRCSAFAITPCLQ
jgi:hypothetical protein